MGEPWQLNLDKWVRQKNNGTKIFIQNVNNLFDIEYNKLYTAQYETVLVFCFGFGFLVLGIKSWTLCMQGKSSTSELHRQLCFVS
jgi:hypothetical protein